MKKFLNPSSATVDYITHIDGLRAIAILWVLVFHAFPGKFPGGFVGVDIFFVISGFLITRQILKAHTEGTWSFLDFYHRRAKRILPAFLLVLLASCGISFLLLPDERQQWSRHVLASLGFFQNFQLFWESGYFDTDAQKKLLLHFWSLAVEEQFYIVFPILLFWLLRRGKRPERILMNIFGSFVAIYLTQWLIAYAPQSINQSINQSISEKIRSLLLALAEPKALFFLPWNRFWELCWGGLLAAISLNPTQSSKLLSFFSLAQGSLLKPLHLAKDIGIALIFIIHLFKASEEWLWPHPVWTTILLLATAGLILSPSPLAQRLLSHPWIRTIGLMSYSLYLWHGLLLSATNLILDGQAPQTLRLAKIGAVSLSLVLSWISWKWVEIPFRQGVWAKPKRLYGSMITLSAITLLIPLSKPMESEFSSFPKAPNGQNKECLDKMGVKNLDQTLWCLREGLSDQIMVKEVETSTILVLGDSHARSLASGWNNQALFMTDRWLIGGSSLIPTNDYFCENNEVEMMKRKHLSVWIPKLLEKLKLMSLKIDHLVVVGRWEGYYSQMQYEPQNYSWRSYHITCTKPNNHLTKSLYNFLDWVKSQLQPKTITLIWDNPEGMALSNARWKARWGEPPKCDDVKFGVPREEWQKRQSYRQAFLADKEFMSLFTHQIDASEILCYQDYCPPCIDNEWLYYDDDHLSAAGARRIWKKWAELVLNENKPE